MNIPDLGSTSDHIDPASGIDGSLQGFNDLILPDEAPPVAGAAPAASTSGAVRAAQSGPADQPPAKRRQSGAPSPSTPNVARASHQHEGGSSTPHTVPSGSSNSSQTSQHTSQQRAQHSHRSASNTGRPLSAFIGKSVKRVNLHEGRATSSAAGKANVGARVVENLVSVLVRIGIVDQDCFSLDELSVHAHTVLPDAHLYHGLWFTVRTILEPLVLSKLGRFEWPSVLAGTLASGHLLALNASATSPLPLLDVVLLESWNALTITERKNTSLADKTTPGDLADLEANAEHLSKSLLNLLEAWSTACSVSDTVPPWLRLAYNTSNTQAAKIMRERFVFALAKACVRLMWMEAVQMITPLPLSLSSRNRPPAALGCKAGTVAKILGFSLTRFKSSITP